MTAPTSSSSSGAMATACRCAPSGLGLGADRADAKRQEMEVQQLSLAPGETAAEGLAFRLAVETDGTGRVERVVLLALRGDDRVECVWPVPLERPAAAAAAGTQPWLLADDGYAGPVGAASKSAPLPPVPPRRRSTKPTPHPRSSLL